MDMFTLNYSKCAVGVFGVGVLRVNPNLDYWYKFKFRGLLIKSPSTYFVGENLFSHLSKKKTKIWLIYPSK